ncbi:MAG: response regulator [Sporichthyaceae bacterium]
MERDTDRRLVVIIVDDHELFAQGLALLLTHRWAEIFEVAGRTTHAEEAAALAVKTRADLAVVDLTMPPLGGVTAIRAIRKLSPHTGILALSGSGDVGLAEEALRAGADGFLSKTAQPDALVAPLRTIAAGMRVLDGAVLDSLLGAARKPDADLLERLGPVDLTLWVLVAAGLETADIARRMVVSERTAKRMVASLLHKLGVSNRIAAAALAGRYGLLDEAAEGFGAP